MFILFCLNFIKSKIARIISRHRNAQFAKENSTELRIHDRPSFRSITIDCKNMYRRRRWDRLITLSANSLNSMVIRAIFYFFYFPRSVIARVAEKEFNDPCRASVSLLIRSITRRRYWDVILLFTSELISDN